MLYISTLA